MTKKDFYKMAKKCVEEKTGRPVMFTTEYQDWYEHNIMTFADTEMPSTRVRIDGYFDDYRNGVPFPTVMQRLENLFTGTAAIVSIDLSHYNDARKMLVPVCVPYDEEALKNRPYIRILDIAMVLKLKVTEPLKGYADLTDEMAGVWNVPTKQMFSDAAVNITPFIKDLPNILGLPIRDGAKTLYYVTNDRREYGASVFFLLPEVREKLAEIFGGDYVIFPSSVHEVLAVGKDAIGLDQAKNMVREINRDVVDPKERLSDNIYFYDSLTKTINVF